MYVCTNCQILLPVMEFHALKLIFSPFSNQVQPSTWDNDVWQINSQPTVLMMPTTTGMIALYVAFISCALSGISSESRNKSLFLSVRCMFLLRCVSALRNRSKGNLLPGRSYLRAGIILFRFDSSFLCCCSSLFTLLLSSPVLNRAWVTQLNDWQHTGGKLRKRWTFSPYHSGELTWQMSSGSRLSDWW